MLCKLNCIIFFFCFALNKSIKCKDDDVETFLDLDFLSSVAVIFENEKDDENIIVYFIFLDFFVYYYYF